MIKFYTGNCLNGLWIVMQEPKAIWFKDES